MSFLNRVREVTADTMGFMSKRDLQEKLPGVFKAYIDTYGTKKPDIRIVSSSDFSFPTERYSMGSWHVVYAVLNGTVKQINVEQYYGKHEKLVPGSMFLDCIKGNNNFCYLHVHPQDANPLLPEGDELTDDEYLVLAIMSGYKSFARENKYFNLKYGYGERSETEYKDILTSLADKKLVKVNKAGSAQLTMEGKNRAVQAKKIAKEKFKGFYG